MAERLALPTSDHGVAGSNPAGGEILPEPKRRFIAQSLSCSPFHHLEMTEIVLKGCKTLTHPSIIQTWCLLSEIYFSKNGHTYVWHVQNDRCHQICFPVSNIQNWEMSWNPFFIFIDLHSPNFRLMTRFIHRWTILVYATLCVSNIMGKWNCSLADIMFD